MTDAQGRLSYTSSPKKEVLIKGDMSVGFTTDCPGLGSRVWEAGLRTMEEATRPQRPVFHSGIGLAGASAGTGAT
jgi:hypothetical protein